MFNSHYMNIVENMTGILPDISPLYGLQENDVYCVKQIIEKFETHPSIAEIKKNINILEKFTIKEMKVSDINTLPIGCVRYIFASLFFKYKRALVELGKMLFILL